MLALYIYEQNKYARNVFRALLMMITPCISVIFLRFLDHREDGGSKTTRNVGNHLPISMPSYQDNYNIHT